MADSVRAVFLLQLLNQCDVFLLGIRWCYIVVDHLLPCSVLRLALFFCFRGISDTGESTLSYLEVECAWYLSVFECWVLHHLLVECV
jgi:hypothetical protein